MFRLLSFHIPAATTNKQHGCFVADASTPIDPFAQRRCHHQGHDLPIRKPTVNNFLEHTRVSREINSAPARHQCLRGETLTRAYLSSPPCPGAASASRTQAVQHPIFKRCLAFLHRATTLHTAGALTSPVMTTSIRPLGVRRVHSTPPLYTARDKTWGSIERIANDAAKKSRGTPSSV